MTSAAAISAANDNSARGATQAPSVEQFETTAKQIGTLMHSVRETAEATQANAASQAPRTFERVVGKTGRIVETCPSYCADSHANDKDGALDDLTHGFYFTGPELPIFDATDGVSLVPILAGRIQTDPYSRDPQRRQPHMNFEPFQDEVMETLTPDEFAQIIATIRAHCDQLDKVHARFAEIHDQWTEPQA